MITDSLTDTAAETLLENLVQIASPSGQEHNASQHLVQWMAQHGYDKAFIDEAGNAVGIRGSGSRDVVLLGHIDTFGGQPPVRREGRLLYGRGSVDAKGSLCTFAVAGARATLPDDVRLIVIGAVEEEASSSKGARFAAGQYQPEMCIIGEPSQWDRLTLGYKGRLLLHWRWRGALAHSAGEIASPPERAFACWQRVQAYVDERNTGEDRLFGRLDATLQDIHSEQDGAYGLAEMTIGFRIPPGMHADDIADALQSDDADTTIDARGQEVPYICERDSPLSRALRGAIRANDGQPTFRL